MDNVDNLLTPCKVRDEVDKKYNGKMLFTKTIAEYLLDKGCPIYEVDFKTYHRLEAELQVSLGSYDPREGGPSERNSFFFNCQDVHHEACKIALERGIKVDPEILAFHNFAEDAEG